MWREKVTDCIITYSCNTLGSYTTLNNTHLKTCSTSHLLSALIGFNLNTFKSNLIGLFLHIVPESLLVYWAWRWRGAYTRWIKGLNKGKKQKMFALMPQIGWSQYFYIIFLYGLHYNILCPETQFIDSSSFITEQYAKILRYCFFQSSVQIKKKIQFLVLEIKWYNI